MIIESLERRTFLDASLSAAGLLKVAGGTADDVITLKPVGTNVVVTIKTGPTTTTRTFAKTKVKTVSIIGGSGVDRISWTISLGVTVDAGAGNDVVVGGPAKDIVKGGGGDDDLRGGGGDDVLTGGPGVDRVDGGAGVDLCSEAFSGTVYCKADGFGPSIALTLEPYFNVERVQVRGGAGADVIDGFLFGQVTGHRLILLGGGGNDHLYGGNGADQLDGGPGNDGLHGFGGADRLIGGTGVDEFDGGAQTDVCTFDKGEFVTGCP
jgi:Ca2+-binding RTX toxin-like protein